jgi:hypothetical protein
MKTKTGITNLISVTGMAAVLALLGMTTVLNAQSTPSVKTMAPSVVKTVPQAGDTAVDPALTELRVTFSKDMKTDRMWSFCQISAETFPAKAGEVHYLADKRTCVMPVKLEPGKTYVIWFNRAQFNAFRDAGNNPAIPYMLVFETKK